MKKTTFFSWLILFVLASTMMVVWPASADEEIYGTMNKAETLHVKTNGKASIKLLMMKGTCLMMPFNYWNMNIYDDRKEQEDYGAFIITWDNHKLLWYNNSGSTPKINSFKYNFDDVQNSWIATLEFPSRGQYEVTITPCTTQQMNALWVADQFIEWVVPSLWTVYSQSNCTTTIKKSTSTYTPASTTGSVDVTVLCKTTGGTLIDSHHETLKQSGYVYAPFIDGYTVQWNDYEYVTVDSHSTTRAHTVTFIYSKDITSCQIYVECLDNDGFYLHSEQVELSESGYVYAPSLTGYRTTGSTYQYVKITNGYADPANITFWYRATANSNNSNNSTGGSNSYQRASSEREILNRAISPASGAEQVHEKGERVVSYDKLSALTDGNQYTKWEHTIWKSERLDQIPDLTLHFYSASIQYIWIRPGNRTGNYYGCARPHQVDLVINGNTTKEMTVYLDDNDYNSINGFQCIDLGQTVNNVYSIEFYFRDYNAGSGDTIYELNISDIIMN